MVDNKPFASLVARSTDPELYNLVFFLFIATDNPAKSICERRDIVKREYVKRLMQYQPEIDTVHCALCEKETHIQDKTKTLKLDCGCEWQLNPPE